MTKLPEPFASRIEDEAKTKLCDYKLNDEADGDDFEENVSMTRARQAFKAGAEALYEMLIEAQSEFDEMFAHEQFNVADRANEFGLREHDFVEGMKAQHALMAPQIEALWARRFELLDSANRWAARCKEEESENKRLREALGVAANQLEGVSLAIREHGTSINPAFFITTYLRMARNARKALDQTNGATNE